MVEETVPGAVNHPDVFENEAIGACGCERLP